MSTETTKSRIRTFARDLEAARTKQSEASSSVDAGDAKSADEVTAPQQPQPTRYAQAPRDLPEIERDPAPKPPDPTSNAPDSRSKDEKRGAKPPTPPQTPIPPKAPTPKTEPAKPVPKKSASTPIPAFHELQKQAQETLKQEAAEAEPDANVPTASGKKASGTRPNLGGYGATVIRDTKHKRFRLFPSIVKSIRDWFSDFQKKKRPVPKYTVSDTERRKGVIQKATAKSGTIFTADSETLKDQIRRRRAATRSAPSPKWETETSQDETEEAEKEANEQEFVWTPNTETGYVLLEEPQDETPLGPQNVAVEFRKPTLLSSPSTEVAAEVKPKPVPESTQPAPEPPKPTNGKNATLADPVSRPDVAPTETTLPPAPVQPDELETVDTVDAQWGRTDTATDISSEPIKPVGRSIPSARAAQASARERLVRQLPNVDVNDTNTLTLTATFVIAAVVVLGLVAWNYFQPLDSNQPVAETPSTLATVYLPGAQASRLTITANQALIPAIKAAATTHGQGVVDVQIYNQSDAVVPPPVIIELLQFDVIPSFRQSLTDVRFATVNRSEPILVFRFTDQTTIRGGFLSWEPSMANDLDDLYDVALTATFVDEQVAGTDVRVLRSADESGAVQLVYGFVDENTALITRTREDFAHIVELTKSE